MSPPRPPRRARGADVTAARGHIPVRRCVACGRRAPKPELARFVADGQDGERTLTRDDRSCSPGRGAYVCRRRECFDRAVQRRGFQRATRVGALVIDPALAEGLADGNLERT